MNFIQGPPTLAVEVRSKSDHGPSAELEMAAKRADYFEAGTAIVWDIDPQAEVVRSYLAAGSGEPLLFGLGEVAQAEPTLPGWRLAVNQIFS